MNGGGKFRYPVDFLHHGLRPGNHGAAAEEPFKQATSSPAGVRQPYCGAQNEGRRHRNSHVFKFHFPSNLTVTF